MVSVTLSILEKKKKREKETQGIGQNEETEEYVPNKETRQSPRKTK